MLVISQRQFRASLLKSTILEKMGWDNVHFFLPVLHAIHVFLGRIISNNFQHNA